MINILKEQCLIFHTSMNDLLVDLIRRQVDIPLFILNKIKGIVYT
jgi:hypothetical protein